MHVCQSERRFLGRLQTLQFVSIYTLSGWINDILMCPMMLNNYCLIPIPGVWHYINISTISLFFFFLGGGGGGGERGAGDLEIKRLVKLKNFHNNKT